MCPFNRGNLGITPLHVHEVAHDCLENRTSQNRYGHACVVEIPPEHLQAVIEFNVRKSRSDPLLPRVHPDRMRYAVLTKTHFVHAHKLAKDGNRTLYDQGRIRINWGPNDREGHEILRQGPLCAIYRAGLYNDQAAAKTLSIEDNLNANVQMGEDEMVAFRRVRAQFEQEETKIRQKHGDVEGHRGELAQAVMDGIKLNGGLASFNRQDWVDLICFRAGLPDTLADVLQQCQMSLCAGRVRVKTSDWGLVAKLDRQAPWAKLCLMMMQYLGSLNPVEVGTNCWSGRRDHFATKLPKDVIEELQTETSFLKEVQDTVIQIMTVHQDVKTTNMLPEEIQTAMLVCRGTLMSNAGKLIKAVGADLLSEAKKKPSGKQPLRSPTAKRSSRRSPRWLGLSLKQIFANCWSRRTFSRKTLYRRRSSSR